MKRVTITYELENVTIEEYEEYIKELDDLGFCIVDADFETWEAYPEYDGDIIRIVFKDNLM